MSSLPSVEDLRLVEAVGRHGSLGAAARELLVSQPAASTRLAALERRIGERLFDRDTTGARPTPAGQAFRTEAAHVLTHLAVIVERTRAAARARTLTVGTFGSLAPWLFPAVEALADGTLVHQVTEHGDRLVEWVGEGSLDVAFVAIADQMRLPATVTATPVATDRLALFSPATVPAGRGRRPFAGREVVTYTYDMSVDALHRRLAELGARPRSAATAETAVRMARQLGCAAVLPSGLATGYARDEERVSAVAVPGRLTLFMVTRRPTPPGLAALVGLLPERLGLSAAPAG
ncbi:LysR family transcriptional regulator [Micromonospora parathelypteridis]|uniref:DNA-binding transcriptional LysR family regulator n=1 Tax=Micromonospora parathelypteridis TaxID=1839617 RepID=A0A840VP62_9ACTN|nr:LysR family transcriptional regulator [Micromonospora parathelypteridis]MBB5478832.1 DNA-binding transcriptional LysR family regulator [Micromonospora parathelypteridis]GGO04341.1 hypothetical protein GCM10011576_05740 [Micromonospora parathelypteridis]